MIIIFFFQIQTKFFLHVHWTLRRVTVQPPTLSIQYLYLKMILDLKYNYTGIIISRVKRGGGGMEEEGRKGNKDFLKARAMPGTAS